MASLYKKIYDKEYVKRNKEKRKKQRHEHYLRNKEKVIEQSRTWKQNNIERVKESNKIYNKKRYDANKQRELMEYYAKLKYERKNPGRHRKTKILDGCLVLPPKD